MKIVIILAFVGMMIYGFWGYIFPAETKNLADDQVSVDTVVTQEPDVDVNGGPDPTTVDVIIEVPPTE